MPRQPQEEHSALEECFIQSFDQGDTDFPIVARKVDPRDPGYAVPADLSACTDSRYPNHKFIGVTPIVDDRRVLWIYRLLPGPLITGQHPRENQGFIVPYSSQDVVADTADGTARAEITPQGTAVDTVVIDGLPTAALLAFAAVFAGNSDVRLPDVLSSVSVSWELPEGTGAYVEAGAMAVTGSNFNINISLSGSGEASAAVIPEIVPLYADDRGHNAPFLDCYVYVAQPVTQAAVLAALLVSTALQVAVTSIVAGVAAAAGHTFSVGEKFQFRTLVAPTGANLAVSTTYFVKTIVAGVSFTYALTLGGATVTTGAATSGTAVPVVQAWPDFRTASETIILTGEKVSLSVRTAVRASFNRSDSDDSVAVSEGIGGSQDFAPSVRAVVLKPAIHAAIAFSGGIDNDATATAAASSEIPASTSWSGAASALEDTLSATGSVRPGDLDATAPMSAIPLLGKYLEQFPTGLGEFYPYSLVSARIRNFAEF